MGPMMDLFSSECVITAFICPRACREAQVFTQGLPLTCSRLVILMAPGAWAACLLFILRVPAGEWVEYSGGLRMPRLPLLCLTALHKKLGPARAPTHASCSEMGQVTVSMVTITG